MECLYQILEEGSLIITAVATSFMAWCAYKALDIYQKPRGERYFDLECDVIIKLEYLVRDTTSLTLDDMLDEFFDLVLPSFDCTNHNDSEKCKKIIARIKDKSNEVRDFYSNLVVDVESSIDKLVYIFEANKLLREKYVLVKKSIGIYFDGLSNIAIAMDWYMNKKSGRKMEKISEEMINREKDKINQISEELILLKDKIVSEIKKNRS